MSSNFFGLALGPRSGSEMRTDPEAETQTRGSGTGGSMGGG